MLYSSCQGGSATERFPSTNGGGPVQTISKSDLYQLRTIYADLKELFHDDLRAGEFDEAHDILMRRIRPLREFFMREEWNVDTTRRTEEY